MAGLAHSRMLTPFPDIVLVPRLALFQSRFQYRAIGQKSMPPVQA